MTCEEFRKLRCKHPRDCTSAERIAFIKHKQSCKECLTDFNNSPDKNNQKLPEEEVKELKELAEKDFNDPEVI